MKKESKVGLSLNATCWEGGEKLSLLTCKCHRNCSLLKKNQSIDLDSIKFNNVKSKN